MSTFLKIVAVFAVVALLVNFCPVVAAPLVVGGTVAVILASVIAGGIAVAVGAALLIVVILGSVLLGLVAAASPVWVPILLIVGLVMLLRGPTSKTV